MSNFAPQPVLEIFELENGLRFWKRVGTNDHNTIYASTIGDEYGLLDLDVADKLVFDVGAYVGSVGISLAVRGARVVCVEPIPANVEMIRRNVRLNDVVDRIHVLEAAAGIHGTKTVRWDFVADPDWNDRAALMVLAPEERPLHRHNDQVRESIEHHRFVGTSNANAPADQFFREADVLCYSLGRMVTEFGVPDIIKIDCEGGEWPWLMSGVADRVALWVGEWHPWGDEDEEGAGSFKGSARHGSYAQNTVRSLLSDTHDVTFSGPEAGPGGFRAERR